MFAYLAICRGVGQFRRTTICTNQSDQKLMELPEDADYGGTAAVALSSQVPSALRHMQLRHA